MITVRTAIGKLYLRDESGSSSTVQPRFLSQVSPETAMETLSDYADRVSALSDAVVYAKEVVYAQIELPTPPEPQETVTARTQIVLVFGDATETHYATLIIPAPVNAVLDASSPGGVALGSAIIQDVVAALVGYIASPDGVLVDHLVSAVVGEGF